MNFIWNSMCKGNSCFNIFQNLTGGSIFCPKTQTPSLWGWENAEFEKVSFAKSAKAFDLTLHSHWLTPPTLVKKEWKRQKIVLFKVNFLDDFSHNDFYFFFPISFCLSALDIFSAGSSSVKIKATYWRIPIDPFWFGLWAGNNFFYFFLRLQEPFLYYLLFANFQSILVNKS